MTDPKRKFRFIFFQNRSESFAGFCITVITSWQENTSLFLTPVPFGHLSHRAPRERNSFFAFKIMFSVISVISVRDNVLLFFL